MSRPPLLVSGACRPVFSPVHRATHGTGRPRHRGTVSGTGIIAGPGGQTGDSCKPRVRVSSLALDGGASGGSLSERGGHVRRALARFPRYGMGQGRDLPARKGGDGRISARAGVPASGPAVRRAPRQRPVRAQGRAEPPQGAAPPTAPPAAAPHPAGAGHHGSRTRWTGGPIVWRRGLGHGAACCPGRARCGRVRSPGSPARCDTAPLVDGCRRTPDGGRRAKEEVSIRAITWQARRPPPGAWPMDARLRPPGQVTPPGPRAGTQGRPAAPVARQLPVRFPGSRPQRPALRHHWAMTVKSSPGP